MRKETPFIGQMDVPIGLYRIAEGKNSVGENITTLLPIASVWSRMRDRSGALDDDDKVIHLNKREYYIRYRSDVMQHRLNLVIKDNGMDYRVYHTAEVQRNKFIKLMAQIHE